MLFRSGGHGHNDAEHASLTYKGLQHCLVCDREVARLTDIREYSIPSNVFPVRATSPVHRQGDVHSPERDGGDGEENHDHLHFVRPATVKRRARTARSTSGGGATSAAAGSNAQNMSGGTPQRSPAEPSPSRPPSEQGSHHHHAAAAASGSHRSNNNSATLNRALSRRLSGEFDVVGSDGRLYHGRQVKKTRWIPAWVTAYTSVGRRDSPSVRVRDVKLAGK